MPFCCICHAGPRENLSFHAVPQCEEMKQKWIQATLKKFSKYSVICSDHFHPSNLQYKMTCKGKLQRYILKGSVPSIIKFTIDEDESLNDNIMISENVQSSIETTKLNELSIFEPVCKLEEESCESNEQPFDIINENVTSASFERTISDNTNVSNNNSKRTRTVRYIGDLKVEDFASPKYYEIVMNFVKKENREKKILRTKLQRTQKKYDNLKELVCGSQKISLKVSS